MSEQRTAWQWREPSATCERLSPVEQTACGRPAVVAYAAMGGGYCALCAEHGRPHRSIVVSLEDARRGVEGPPDMLHAREAPTDSRWAVLRRRAGISEAAAAAHVGIRPTSLRAYERGAVPMPGRTWRKLSVLYGGGS